MHEQHLNDGVWTEQHMGSGKFAHMAIDVHVVYCRRVMSPKSVSVLASRSMLMRAASCPLHLQFDECETIR